MGHTRLFLPLCSGVTPGLFSKDHMWYRGIYLVSVVAEESTAFTSCLISDLSTLHFLFNCKSPTAAKPILHPTPILSTQIDAAKNSRSELGTYQMSHKFLQWIVILSLLAFLWTWNVSHFQSQALSSKYYLLSYSVRCLDDHNWKFPWDNDKPTDRPC